MYILNIILTVFTFYLHFLKFIGRRTIIFINGAQIDVNNNNNNNNNSNNNNNNRIEKLRKYQQLAFKFRERREQYRVTVVPLVIGCLGGGIKQQTKGIKVLFKPEDVNSILSEMQKVVLWESETILRKVTPGLMQSVL